MELTALLETLLKDNDLIHATDQVVSVVKTSDVVRPGDSHLSTLNRLEVVIECPVSKSRTKRWFISKDLPEGPFSRAYVELRGYFVRELTFYRDILTVYESLMDEMGSGREIPWPRCINIEPYSRVIIEDLQPLGFTLCSQDQYLDLDHCVLAMQTLGFFHALGILAVERQLITLEDFSKDYILGDDSVASQFCVALGKLVDALESWGSEWESTAREIRLVIPDAKTKLKVIFSGHENRLNVLNHGDYRQSNLLFKYDDNSGKPEKIRFIDFQMAHYLSPALDLVYFLTFSPDMNVRRRNVDHLIQVYHRSLTMNMDELGVAAPPPLLSDIQDQVNSFGLLKLCMLLIVAPRIIMNDPNAEPFCLEEYLKSYAEACERHEPVELPCLDFENEQFRGILEVTLREAIKKGSLK